MIFVGAWTFLLSTLGFIFSSDERRPLIMLYAVLAAVTVPAQMSTVFIALEARSYVFGEEIKELATSAASA